MRDFIDYLQEAFITASGGNTYDNSYSNLDLTSRSLLHFPTPTGSRITLSSFVRPKFGTSYSIGIKDGWVSYLYSTLPTDATTSSDRIPLPDLLRSYRSLSTNAPRHAVGHGLVYGRLYLPQSRLEALLAARVTPEVNLSIRAVSQETLRHGGTALALASWDDPAGRFGIETLASSDGGVLGLRGLWNATNPPTHTNGTEVVPGTAAPTRQPSTAIPITPFSDPTAAAATTNTSNTSNHNSADKERINGRFSVGGEIYYGLLNKSGGLSLGGRFQTLPTHAGTPLTAALTFNLLGHLSATYAVMAGRGCTLASQFGFNIYSYESDWAVGVELWRVGGGARKGQGGGGGGGEAEPSGPTAAAAGPSVAGDDEGISKSANIPPHEAEAVLAARAGLDREIDPSLAEAMHAREANNNSIKTAAAASTTATPPAAQQATKQRSFKAKLEWRLDGDGENNDHTPAEAYDPSTGAKLTTTATGLGGEVSSSGEGEWHGDGDGDGDSPAGVVKCRCDQHMRVGLMYEGRYKSLLFSLGTDVDLRRLDAPFQGVGLAVQFSS
ncbi:putative mitochondrial inheritance component mdm10 [Diaporthe ampelina]|uniref:Mitochondrial distribution and morphology protein 10 n=1 Tax=Diaporthe ampelina TaxID=1214573 RepID=A0A0G2ICK4_9PEZI|nr:putative mitochondrial inheritance component mdm10 [Diaporthe ampelina]